MQKTISKSSLNNIELLRWLKWSLCRPQGHFCYLYVREPPAVEIGSYNYNFFHFFPNYINCVSLAPVIQTKYFIEFKKPT